MERAPGRRTGPRRQEVAAFPGHLSCLKHRSNCRPCQPHVMLKHLHSMAGLEGAQWKSTKTESKRAPSSAVSTPAPSLFPSLSARAAARTPHRQTRAQAALPPTVVCLVHG